MANKDIKITLKTALDAAGIEATKSQMRTLQKSVSDSMRGMAADNKMHWADIKAVWDMGLGAIRKVANFLAGPLRKAFDAEYALTNFKTLLNSIDDAKEHVAELKQFAASTPLTFGDLSQGSKTLLAFGVSVGDIVPNLKMLGDISFGNAEKMQNLTFAFGKVASSGKMTAVELKQMIAAGFNPLQEISSRTGESMTDLRKKMENGEISFGHLKLAMLDATSEGGRFYKAMESASQTGHGLFSTMSDNWSMTVSKFGSAFMDAAKGGMAKVIEVLKNLRENGTLDKWANGIVWALGKVADAFKTVTGWISNASDFLKVMKETWVDAFAVSGDVIGGMMDGLSFDEAVRQAGTHQGIREGHRAADRWAEANLHKLVDDTQYQEEAKRGAEEDLRQLKEEMARQDALDMIEEAKYQKEQQARQKKRKAAEKKAQKDRETAEKKAQKDREAAEKKERQRIAEAEIEGVREDNRREQQRIKDRIKQLNKEIADIEKARKVTGRGMATDARVNDFGKAYRYSLDENGVIDNFTDWERAQRYAGRAARDQATRDKRRELDDKKMKDLENRLNNGEKLSKSQEKRLDNWRKFQEERDGVARRQKQIEKLREDAEKAAIEGEKHLKVIRQKMADFVEGPVLK